MELPTIAGAWLVLDHPSLGEVLPVFVVVFLGISLLVGAAGAAVVHFLQGSIRKGFLITAIATFLILLVGLIVIWR